MAVLSFLLIISLFITQIQAADISLEYVGDSEFFDSNSLFIDPNIIGNKTITSSNGTFTLTHEVAEDQSSIERVTDIYYIYCDGFTDNMSITIIYDEIGTYNGETVGCKFTIYNVVFSQGNSSNYSYPVFNIYTNLYYGITANNVLSASFSAEFFYASDPDSIIDVSGAYVSFGSVSEDEMITVLDTVTNAYVSSDTDITTFDIDGITYYSTKSSGASSDYVDTVGSSTFNKATVTLKFENSLTFGIAITKASRAMWFTMSTSALGLTQPADPIKTVDEQTSVTNKTVGDVITYKIAQTVHTMGENTLECYSSLIITDTLPSEVTYNTSNPAYLTDSNGNVISNAGTVSFNNSTNTVAFTFSSDYLTNTMAYEGETYVLVIPCTINSNATSGSTFSNIATVNFDSYPTVTSNEATVTMGYEITTSVTNGTITDSVTDAEAGEDCTIEYSPDSGYLIDTIVVDDEGIDITEYPDSYTFYDLDNNHTIEVVYVKPEASKNVYIYQGTSSSSYTTSQNVEGTILAAGDVIEYRISYENPTSATRTVVITDALPSGLTITKVSDSGTVSGRSVSWTLSVEAYGSGYVSIYAKVGENAGTLTNNAKVTIKALSGSTTESDVLITDTVTVYGMDSPVKQVKDSDGNDVSGQTVSAGDVLTYYISFTNTSASTKTFYYHR